MKIVCYRDPDGGRPHVGALLGALLGEEREILDFDAPGADLPVREECFAWHDLAGGHYEAAAALVAEVQRDPQRLDALRTAGAVVPRDAVRLTSPVLKPRKVICIGLNYRDHAAESGMDIPEQPLVFSKFSTSVVGPQEPVVLPPGAHENDYEAELGVVIGRVASRVDEAHALDHVLGYTCVNDVSARDFQFADRQWQRGKSPDTFCPVGEFIATVDEIPEPEQLAIRFRLNGETLQDSNTDQLIFGVRELVAFLSGFTTLEPGDLIATGTPPGVGFARKPPIYIRSGDRMEVEIEGLGVLVNPVVGSSGSSLRSTLPSGTSIGSQVRPPRSW